MDREKYYGSGKRKTSIARVWMVDGEGKVKINNKEVDQTLCTESSQSLAFQPLTMTNLTKKYDLAISVHGGGVMGQAGAIRHGISNALLHSDPNLRLVLKRAGLLTRDSRVKERKKYGQKGARKKFQFSKR